MYCLNQLPLFYYIDYKENEFVIIAVKKSKNHQFSCR